MKCFLLLIFFFLNINNNLLSQTPYFDTLSVSYETVELHYEGYFKYCEWIGDSCYLKRENFTILLELLDSNKSVRLNGVEYSKSLSIFKGYEYANRILTAYAIKDTSFNFYLFKNEYIDRKTFLRCERFYQTDKNDNFLLEGEILFYKNIPVRIVGDAGSFRREEKIKIGREDILVEFFSVEKLVIDDRIIFDFREVSRKEKRKEKRKLKKKRRIKKKQKSS
jgi:hypothetical protein